MSTDPRAAVAQLIASYGGEPDAEGWFCRDGSNDNGFGHLFGLIRVRLEGATVARVRFLTPTKGSNVLGFAHGGYLLAAVDQAIFVGPTACGFSALGGATVDLTSQFLAPVAIGPVIDIVTEVLRETNRMLFVRGLIEQDGDTKLAFSATIRKPS